MIQYAQLYEVYEDAMKEEQKGNHDPAIRLYSNIIDECAGILGIQKQKAVAVAVAELAAEDNRGRGGGTARAAATPITSSLPPQSMVIATSQSTGSVMSPIMRKKRLTEVSQPTLVSLRELLALAFNNRGQLRYLNADFDEALEDYSQALTQDTNLAVAYYNRGLIYYRIGRFQAAIDDQVKAIDIKGDFPSAGACLSEARHELRKESLQPK